jgi:hypothetical protein
MVDGDFTFLVLDDRLKVYEGFKSIVTNKSHNGIKQTIIDKEQSQICLIDTTKILKCYEYSQENVSLSNATIIPFDSYPTGLYKKDEKIYVTLDNGTIHEIDILEKNIVQSFENLGKDISQPFTYDSSTINYVANNQLKVYFVNNSFIDGSSGATYSSVNSDDIAEGEGCFIATAAYGSYFNKHVKLLRDFRDDVLLKTYLGKEFVKLYYKYSPNIAKEVSKSQYLKSLVRTLLLPVVYTIKYPLLSLLVFFMAIFIIFIRPLSNRRRITQC